MLLKKRGNSILLRAGACHACKNKKNNYYINEVFTLSLFYSPITNPLFYRSPIFLIDVSGENSLHFLFVVVFPRNNNVLGKNSNKENNPIETCRNLFNFFPFSAPNNLSSGIYCHCKIFGCRADIFNLALSK